jgi:hypothetical protein
MDFDAWIQFLFELDVRSYVTRSLRATGRKSGDRKGYEVDKLS